MNNYETVFILTPDLSEAQVKEKKTTGYYQLVEFQAQPETIAVLETQFRRDENVLRFLTFRQDKFAAEYAAKRRSRKA